MREGDARPGTIEAPASTSTRLPRDLFADIYESDGKTAALVETD
jgi:hypothetical protein